MEANRARRYRLQELVINERLTDASSPATLRLIETYEKTKIRGEGDHKLVMGRLAVEWEDAQPPDTQTPADGGQ